MTTLKEIQTDVQRFDMQSEYNKYACQDQVIAIPDDTGRWILYAEHAYVTNDLRAYAKQLERENKDLKASIVRYSAELSRMTASALVSATSPQPVGAVVADERAAFESYYQTRAGEGLRYPAEYFALVEKVVDGGNTVLVYEHDWMQKHYEMWLARAALASQPAKPAEVGGVVEPKPCKQCDHSVGFVCEDHGDEEDPYTYACELMEQAQKERANRGVEIGTQGSLCDGIAWIYDHARKLEATLAAQTSAPGPKPFAMPGEWFPVGLLGHPMREFAPGKWESATWPSEQTAAPQAVDGAQSNPHAATYPERIWLQAGDGDADEMRPYSEGSEITWCWENINSNDVAYVRADLAAHHPAPEAHTDGCAGFQGKPVSQCGICAGAGCEAAPEAAQRCPDPEACNRQGCVNPKGRCEEAAQAVDASRSAELEAFFDDLGALNIGPDCGGKPFKVYGSAEAIAYVGKAVHAYQNQAQQAVDLSDDRIREIFMANGFTIKEGQSDLKPYVFAAARALLAAGGKVSGD